MSVMMLDLPIYNYFRAGIEKAAYNNEINEFYFYSVRKHFENKDIPTEAFRIVKSWSNMNEKSYCNRYNEKNQNLSEFIEPTYTHKPLEIIQFIKYLQCLIYNIEIIPFSEQEKADFELLKNILDDSMNAYISNLEEYKKASWSN